MKIVFPMLGRGSKFNQEGRDMPKILIDVKGKPMFEWAFSSLDNFDLEKNAICIVLREHVKKYGLDKKIRSIAGKSIQIIESPIIPRGAAETVLLAKKNISPENELIISNSDQFFQFDLKAYLSKKNRNFDGLIPYFHATHPRWSYIETDEKNRVIKTVEKEVISNKATVGVYYFKKGKDFIEGASDMIEKKIMVSGEYYVCPVYNLLIEKNIRIEAVEVEAMWSLGTPEDVEHFEKYFKKSI